MLVFSRKKSQEIMIRADIKVCVLGIQGDMVRLGIDAPQNVKILRGELLDGRNLEKRTDGEPSPPAAGPPLLGS